MDVVGVIGDHVSNTVPDNTIGSVMETTLDLAMPNKNITSAKNLGTDEVGTHSPSSSDLSNFFSLSNNISNFLRHKKVHDVGELESYSRHEHVFSHWIWAMGMRKGEKLDNNRAKSLLQLKHFDKTLMKPIFYITAKTSTLSVDIQQILGNTKVVEYGSFVD